MPNLSLGAEHAALEPFAAAEPVTAGHCTLLSMHCSSLRGSLGAINAALSCTQTKVILFFSPSPPLQIHIEKSLTTLLVC